MPDDMKLKRWKKLSRLVRSSKEKSTDELSLEKLPIQTNVLCFHSHERDNVQH